MTAAVPHVEGGPRKGFLQLPSGHRIARVDRYRITCTRCGRRALWVLYSRWTIAGSPGIAFYPYCSKCWFQPGPVGESPAKRAVRP